MSPSTPLSEPTVRTATGGAVGAVVSMVSASGTDTVEVLPAGSVEVVVIECTPSVNTVDVKVHVPLAATTAVPSSVVPS